MRAIFRRVAALEARKRLSFPQRVIVQYCYEGEEPPEPPEDCDENTLRVLVTYVAVPLPGQGGEMRS